MSVYEIDPLSDPRWSDFLLRHADATIFHTSNWLRALHRTYRYVPVVYTTCRRSQELRNGIPFCKINSWLTGRRLVSVPFSDYCQPLIDSAEDLQELLSAVKYKVSIEGMKYIEVRPLTIDPRLAEAYDGFEKSAAYYTHSVDLAPDADRLFKAFHKNNVQRAIKRAQKERVEYGEGTSESHLLKFYQLLVITRRKHRLPPQPLSWFRSLIDCLRNIVKIRIAYRRGVPIASILTLQYKQRQYYKYGCMSNNLGNVGATPMLLWTAIKDARQQQIKEFDLGRSDFDQPGLIEFKDRWGSSRETISYYRYPGGIGEMQEGGRLMRAMHVMCSALPEKAFIKSGELLYPHIG